MILPLGIVGLDQFRVNPNDEHFLVVRAIENPDLAATGHGPRISPKEVVVELFGRRALEAIDHETLRIDAGNHVLDRAVFTRGIHGLEDDEDRPRSAA